MCFFLLCFYVRGESESVKFYLIYLFIYLFIFAEPQKNAGLNGLRNQHMPSSSHISKIKADKK